MNNTNIKLKIAIDTSDGKAIIFDTLEQPSVIKAKAFSTPIGSLVLLITDPAKLCTTNRFRDLKIVKE